MTRASTGTEPEAVIETTTESEAATESETAIEESETGYESETDGAAGYQPETVAGLEKKNHPKWQNDYPSEKKRCCQKCDSQKVTHLTGKHWNPYFRKLQDFPCFYFSFSLAWKNLIFASELSEHHQ